MKHKKHKALFPYDRFYINSPEYNNCALCAIEKEGPMTQEKVGRYMGVCKMRICQIEKEATRKFKDRLKKRLVSCEKDFTDTSLYDTLT